MSSIPIRDQTTLGKQCFLYSLPSNNLVCIHENCFVNNYKGGQNRDIQTSFDGTLSNDSCLPRPLLHFYQKQMPEKDTIILSLFKTLLCFLSSASTHKSSVSVLFKHKNSGYWRRYPNCHPKCLYTVGI